MPRSALLLLLALSIDPATGQTTGHDHHAGHHSPYANQEQSGIAALSQQEKEDLENGAGMGLARAAELNRYPGPKHVLELAEELNLSEEQLTEVERIHAEMLAEAQRVGREILEKESHLDQRFAHRHIDEPTLRQLTHELGVLYGELRHGHLAAHLQVTSILTQEQIEAYDSLRGYTKNPA
jgi:hypothetical protein